MDYTRTNDCFHMCAAGWMQSPLHTVSITYLHFMFSFRSDNSGFFTLTFKRTDEDSTEPLDDLDCGYMCQ